MASLNNLLTRYRPNDSRGEWPGLESERCELSSWSGPQRVPTDIGWIVRQWYDGWAGWNRFGHSRRNMHLEVSFLADYVSLTGWSYDAPAWSSGVKYIFGSRVTFGSPLRSFQLMDVGGDKQCGAHRNDNHTFSSTNTKPDDAGGRLRLVVFSGRALFFGTLLYSHTGVFECKSGYESGRARKIAMVTNYEALLWNDREYVAGDNGEKYPMDTSYHDDLEGEGQTLILSSCGLSSYHRHNRARRKLPRHFEALRSSLRI